MVLEIADLSTLCINLVIKEVDNVYEHPNRVIFDVRNAFNSAKLELEKKNAVRNLYV